MNSRLSQPIRTWALAVKNRSLGSPGLCLLCLGLSYPRHSARKQPSLEPSLIRPVPLSPMWRSASPAWKRVKLETSLPTTPGNMLLPDLAVGHYNVTAKPRDSKWRSTRMWR